MRKISNSKYRQYYDELIQEGNITLTFATEEEAHSFRNCVQYKFIDESLSTSLSKDRVTVTAKLNQMELVSE